MSFREFNYRLSSACFTIYEDKYTCFSSILEKKISDHFPDVTLLVLKQTEPEFVDKDLTRFLDHVKLLNHLPDLKLILKRRLQEWNKNEAGVTFKVP